MKLRQGSGVEKFAVLLLAAFGLMLAAPGVVYAMEYNVTVDVSIAAMVEITVSPDSLNWSNVVPGTAGGTKQLDVQNTGSTNITNVYAFITTLENETVSPYGSSNSQLYSAGGVVTYRNQSNTKYYWAGRLEWNWTEVISNTDKSAIPSTSRIAEGFFRNASVSFYWAVGNGTAGVCSGAGALFAVEDNTDNGTVTTRTPDASSINRDGGDEGYSYFSVSRASNFLNGACVAVSADCTKVYAYKFDRRTGAFNGSTCANSVYINSGQMAPNEIETVTADVWVPLGIPQGNLKRATWTFVAS